MKTCSAMSLGRNVLLTVALLFAVLPSPSQAGYQGDVSFTQEEIDAHTANIQIIAEEASSCLNGYLDRHLEFYRLYGIAKYYGDNSSFSKRTYADKRALLRSLGKDPALVDQMGPTSCIGLTLKCLGAGFAVANQQATWKKLNDFTRLNDVSGEALQFALRKLGWKILYWNPDTSMSEAWDQAEIARNPENTDYFRGFHVARQRQVQTRGMYYWNPIDDSTSLVDFKREVPQKFKDVPIFVGTAHQGYHVFPGAYGIVTEGHSTRAITDRQTIEQAPFNPLQNGGAPRGLYRSGMIAVPPGFGF